ncbi:MAG: Bug family tripartite tricarboxylate transporter substrate binding protein [Beijerinckiaceae bacterium]
MTGNTRRAIRAAGLASAIMPALACAQTPEEFYKGRNITLQVGYAPGGGYDVYARFLSRSYGQHLPGKPNVVVQNVPGAGSLKLANQLYHSAPRDGSVIGAIGREQITAPLFKVKGAQFDATKINWLGTLDRSTSLCVTWHTTGVTKIEQLREKEIALGGTGPASLTVVLPTALRELMGYKVKIIAGYPGGNEVALALERGEVQGRCGWSYSSLMSTYPRWISEGKLNVLAAASSKRLPELPHVPTVLELAKDDRTKQILALIVAPEEMARPYLAPPEVPADRLAALRDGFSKLIQDESFVKEGRAMGLELDPVDWKEMTADIERLYATPAEVVNIGMRLIAGDKP